MIDRKAVLYSFLTFMITLSAMVYAQNIYSYNIGVVIEVPEAGGIIITGLREDDYGNMLLSKMVLRDDTASTGFTIENTGSVDYEITKSLTSPPGLELKLEAFIEHSTGGDSWTSDTFTLERGTSASIRLTVTDTGAEPGLHDIAITIGATPS